MRRLLLSLLAAIALIPIPASAAPTRPDRHERHERPAPDPLIPILHRMNRYFRRNEVDGVTLDRRYDLDPSETIRLSVVCQLLGYVELYRVHPSRAFHRAIVSRADYLLPRFDQVRSGSTFDGMLGEALLEAYDVTRDARDLDYGKRIVDEIEALSPDETILNGGLMGALVLAKYHQLTGDEAAAQRTRDILASQIPYQHADGSFPHWCACSKDVHYTDWMSMELMLIERMFPDPSIDPMLRGTLGFIESRVDSTGDTHYEAPCATCEGGVEYYYSIATGCWIDYDTRAFTNELGYSAMLFDHFGSPQYGPVIRFMDRLENGGTFKDKWAFWPPPTDPYYPWTAADTSVVNMSVIFWSLSSTLHGRMAARPHECDWVAEAGEDDDVPMRSGTNPAPSLLPASGAHPSFEREPVEPGDGGFRAQVDGLLALGADPNGYCDAPAGGAPPAVRPPLPALAHRTLSASALALTLAGPQRGGDRAIRFTLPASGLASLSVYDLAGRRVRGLAGPWLTRGTHQVSWDLQDERGRRSAPGVYFARLLTGERSLVVRLVVTP